MRSLPPLLAALLLPALAHAGGAQSAPLQEVTIVASAAPQLGDAASATEGTISGAQLENRPLARTGELLEAVPGLIVTQHSGDGKANQYYLRGFNLDHGTDFRTTVMGMPANMPSHAHGQGYTDLNFLIPELIDTIRYKKGVYDAREGDFANAGAAAIDYRRQLEQGMALLELGQENYRRALLADSLAWRQGTLLYALEAAGQDGPWDVPEAYRRVNAYLSYSWGDNNGSGSDKYRLSAMAMDASWRATDQVPLRAIRAGLLDRYGTLDASDGGSSARYSLAWNWKRRYDGSSLAANVYLIRSRLDLFSDFTYALNDPVHGDQFEQAERRTVFGGDLEQRWQHALAGQDSETALGLQWRSDRLDPVGLYDTAARQRTATVREDRLRESSAALYLSNQTSWTPWLRSIAGLRGDVYRYSVASDRAANSGSADASLLSPKLSLIFKPAAHAELYLQWGQGFHSNDARGVLQTVDPRTALAASADGSAVARATPLVKTNGKELGLRLDGLVPGLQTSLSWWQLDLDSELVFAGDAGSTEPSRPSRRTGVELANYYVPAPGWIIDADLAWSRARFRDADPAGPYIPGAIERTASLGISGARGKWSGGVRLRYFGARPLIADNSVRSPASTLVNAKLGYAFTSKTKLSVEVLNLFNRSVSDVDYYYASRLRGEAAAVADVHTHPAEPRSLRLALQFKF